MPEGYEMRVLESQIERAACEKIRDKLGITCIKLVTPGATGYPDRLFWIPGGKPLLIEFKRPGEPPDPIQIHIHAQLRDLGYYVIVCDSVESAMHVVQNALTQAWIANKPSKSASLSK
jgi:hypothetical protein